MTEPEIVAEYQRREDAAGGIVVVGIEGSREIQRQMADDLSLPTETIRAALVDAWAKSGGG